ncbi:DUF2345 domain-containing protein [Erwinia amylovora]|uniref:DUF2345 domain-containing protein n=1 Tax=Erwinia amylovora TaxID=552 RepID=UPI0002C8E239|nr:DUF2345 domain-containing protein [Erwinia amylovora]CCP05890.1 hypothetical protein BN440_0839 [Erwinia amylovora MR1]
MSADQQVTVFSSKDEVIISTPKTLTLNGGGSWLKLSESGIEQGTNGDFITKAARYPVPMSAANMQSEPPVFDKTTPDLQPSETDGIMSR